MLLLVFGCFFFYKGRAASRAKGSCNMKTEHGDKGKMGAGRPLSISTYLIFLYYCYLIRCSYTKGFCVQKKKKKEMSCTFVACTLGGSSKSLNQETSTWEAIVLTTPALLCPQGLTLTYTSRSESPFILFPL